MIQQLTRHTGKHVLRSLKDMSHKHAIKSCSHGTTALRRLPLTCSHTSPGHIPVSSPRKLCTTPNTVSSAPTAPVRLSLQALESAQLPKSLNIPQYARSDISPGILHFGVGNFHRAHQGMFLHQLFQKGSDLDWAVVGAGIRPAEMPQYEKLRNQDFLSTVVEQSATSETATVIGCMVEYVEPAKYQAILERLVQPDIRIVSLTVTEGGYFLTDTRDFDSNHPEVQQDAAGKGPPRTVFGLIVAALKERRQKAIPPFTVVSCDNIPHNGAVAMNAVCSLASLSDPDFSEWIKENVSFPNSMIDRITPATGDRERSFIRESSMKPRFEDVGVSFVQISQVRDNEASILNEHATC
ncbi:Mannitol dehydrogenase [Gracilaria domingensis]|nr:Mannitol dehydrogenase [Gracilaria domingensis]